MDWFYIAIVIVVFGSLLVVAAADGARRRANRAYRQGWTDAQREISKNI